VRDCAWARKRCAKEICPKPIVVAPWVAPISRALRCGFATDHDGGGRRASVRAFHAERGHDSRWTRGRGTEDRGFSVSVDQGLTPYFERIAGLL